MTLPVVAVVFGTRPEAIKMVPVLRALGEHRDVLRTVTVSTGQHREMLDQILGPFGVAVDHEMSLMVPNQSLYALSSRAIAGFEEVLARTRPQLVLVQGDTTTAMLGALAASYGKVACGHVEAGLRTSNKYFPFPEEINRRLITVLADVHFAPTAHCRDALLGEGIPSEQVLVTGNTGIDTLLLAAKLERPVALPDVDLTGKRLLLVTAHRRESFGQPMVEIFGALRELAGAYPDLSIVYPVHLNPNVREPAAALLGGLPNLHLIAPLDYFAFVKLMSRAYLILTDSGGVQEEAPTLGVPVLVLRNETERGEAIAAGAVRLAGTVRADIVREARRVLDDPAQHRAMTRAVNPYGDGRAGPRIAAHVLQRLGLDASRYREIPPFA